MTELLDKFASGKSVVVSLLALVLGTSALFSIGPYATVQQLNEARPLPEEQLSSAEYTVEVLERIGVEGREMYASFQLMDVLNPILICTFLIVLLAWLSRLAHCSQKVRVVAFVPLVVAVAELWENSLLYTSAVGFPAVPAGLDSLQIATALKFGGGGLFNVAGDYA